MSDMQGSLKVLVADEDKDIRFLVKVHLRDYISEITEARDGDEALKKINSDPPDLIILNYMLDTISGYELADKLSKDKNLQDIPVIVLTLEGFDLYEDKSGVDDYLAKPFLRAQFLEVVRKVIDLEKYRKTDARNVKKELRTAAFRKQRKISDSGNKKILIADDEENIIKLLELILAEYELDIATSGEELVEKVLSGKRSGKSYDLIISDVVMPGLSGWKSIKKVRDEGINCPVIFNSGLVKDKDLYETLKPAGQSEFILKPFKKATLLGTVKEFIG
ncbi:MAG: response regulator [Elusimicrobia bacterium]|jgi:CheY-like chemotaxis protein|nr:response regulator [Elusimicrobiota bacterium]